MDIINLGGGPRWAAWAAAARAQRDVRSIAIVSQSRGGSEGGTGVRSYSTLESACKEMTPGVAILTGPAALDERQAIEVLARGMHVILDRPDMLNLAALTRMAGMARQNDRAVILAMDGAAASPAARLRPLLGKVGSIGHVSYVDRRPRSDLDGVASGARYAQLIRFGLAQLEGLRSLFDAAPVRVMARYSETPWSNAARGTTAEILLELEKNIHVQYFGSTSSSHHEQSLWVEGRGGSLRSDGANAWWRKRGWPRFMLWRWWPGTTTDAMRRFADAARQALDSIQQSVSGGPTADAARRAALAPLALLGSVMRSSEESRLVDIADWMNSSAATAIARTQPARST